MKPLTRNLLMPLVLPQLHTGFSELSSIYTSSDSPWINMANLNIDETNILLFLGPQWSYKQVDKIKKTHFGRMLF